MADSRLIKLDNDTGQYIDYDPTVDTFTFKGVTLGGNLDMGGFKVTGAADGVANNELATVGQVQHLFNGRIIKPAVKAATIVALPAYTFLANVLTASVNGAFPTIDTVAAGLLHEYLVKNESGANEKYNGIYVLTVLGDDSTPWELTRRDDADSSDEVITSMMVPVSEGNVNDNTIFMLFTNGTIDLNTTALNFGRWYLNDLDDGDGISISGNIVSVRLKSGGGLSFATGEVQIGADAIEDTMINWGTGAGQIAGGDIPLVDSGNYFDTDDVEAALQQLALEAPSAGFVKFIAGIGGVTKGDVVYLSANDTVLPYSNITVFKPALYVAMQTISAAAEVQCVRIEGTILGMLSDATFGTQYFWDGTTWAAGALGSIYSNNDYIIAVGSATNATDVYVQLERRGRYHGV